MGKGNESDANDASAKALVDRQPTVSRLWVNCWPRVEQLSTDASAAVFPVN